MTCRASRRKPGHRRIGFQGAASEVEILRVLTIRVRLNDSRSDTQGAACEIHKTPGIGKCACAETKLHWPDTGVHVTARNVQRSVRIGAVHRDAQVGGHRRSAHEAAAWSNGELPDTFLPGKNQPIARVVVERTGATHIDHGSSSAGDPNRVEAARVERAPGDVKVTVATVLGHPLGVLTVRPESARTACGLIHDRDAAGNVRPGEILVISNAAADVDDGVARCVAVGQVARSGEAGQRAGDVQGSAGQRGVASVGIGPGQCQGVGPDFPDIEKSLSGVGDCRVVGAVTGGCVKYQGRSGSDIGGAKYRVDRGLAHCVGNDQRSTAGKRETAIHTPVRQSAGGADVQGTSRHNGASGVGVGSRQRQGVGTHFDDAERALRGVGEIGPVGAVSTSGIKPEVGSGQEIGGAQHGADIPIGHGILNGQGGTAGDGIATVYVVSGKGARGGNAENAGIDRGVARVIVRIGKDQHAAANLGQAADSFITGGGDLAKRGRRSERA